MEGEPRSASKTASREASEWFVSLQDDPDDVALRQRFNEWLTARPENAAAWSATLHASALAESLLPFDARDWESTVVRKEGDEALKAPAAPSFATGRGPGRRAIVPPVLRFKRRWLLSLVVPAAIACVAFLAAPAAILRLQSDYLTGAGQVQDVELQDGSMVTLAPSSAITVSYTTAERQVGLLSGEAFFSVTPNAARPFRVVAGGVQASVLGTRFDVQLERRGVAVSVKEGKVQVDAAAVSEILTAGQSIRLVPGDAVVQRSSQSPQMIGTWMQGQLVMEDGPLGAAVEQLGRYFDGTIILASASLGERPVTGVFDLRDPEGALRAMAKALGVKVRKVTPWILVVSAS